MIARVQEFWSGRSPRERAMLAFMIAALGVFAAWFLVVQPLGAWAYGAAQGRLSAETDLIRIKAAGQPPRARPDNLEATLRSTAAAQGLEPIIGMSEEGGLGFRLATGDGQSVLRWLAAIKAATGTEPLRLSILIEDGQVAVDGAF